ncbi:amidohydrolase family protein [Idiomarina loihiensis]|uniref:amidohydrolase family protein n=1 Tax=Idiomarina loihiensis TaxID=135577 RepID=UPI001A3F76C9|nr:amidohydrolase family protein [Idiomarina sp.]
MKIKIIAALFVVVIALIILSLPTPREESAKTSNSFILGPVNIFDGETISKAAYVEVRDGYIKDLHMERPDSQLRKVDGQNRWLVPGLIDAHVHTWGDALEQSLERGVTTVIDMFGHPNFLRQHQPQRATTKFSRKADIFGAGLLITAPNGHGTQYGIEVSTLSKPQEAEKLIKQRINAGSDFIKIVYTRNGSAYAHAPSISEQGLQAAIRAAHKQNYLAVVHIADHDSALDAVEAGADGLVHSFFDQPVSDELLALLKINGVFVIPTMTVYEGMLRGSINDEILLNNETLKISASAKSTLNRNFPNSGRFPEHFYTNLLINTKRMHNTGIPILAGSDAPNPNTAHGWSLLVELLLFQEAGMPTEAILKSATSKPADAFSLADRGRIREGMKADFLLLQKSPYKDLKTILEPLRVWKNGYLVSSKDSARNH